jgi:ketosteroid isomerase-like protein
VQGLTMVTNRTALAVHLGKRTGLLIGLVLAAISVSAHAGEKQQDAQSVELLNLDRQWQEAVTTGDAKFIEEWTGDDLVFTHSGGFTDGKADWIRRATEVPRTNLERKVSNQSLEMHGDVALVFGRLDVRAILTKDAARAPSCYTLEYVHLYARRNGKWQFVSHRTTSHIGETHLCEIEKK